MLQLNRCVHVPCCWIVFVCLYRKLSIFSVTVSGKARSSLKHEKKATCWNPERTRLRKPAVYNQQTVDAYKALIENHG